MDFIPEEKKSIMDVPYFEDADSASGFAGHTTTKSEERLKAEIGDAIIKLGGIITGWQRGTFGNRPGYRMHFNIPDDMGRFIPG